MSHLLHKPQVVADQLSIPNLNGFLYFYENGTQKPKAIFADPELTIAQANPIRLSPAAEYGTNGRHVYFDGLATVELRKRDNSTILRQLENVSRRSLSSDNMKSIDSIADLKNLTEDDGTIIFARGYYAVADGGGGHYVFDESSSEPDNGGSTVAPNSGTGRWKLVNDDVITVEQFGAGSTQTAATNTRAFQQAMAASPRVLCFQDSTYSVFPTIAGNDLVLFDLSHADGVTIDGRGAELRIAGAFGGNARRATIFLLHGASNITIRNFTLTGSEETVENRFRQGMIAFFHRAAAQNIVIQNIRQISGRMGIACKRNPLTEAFNQSCKRILVDNYETVGVAYPLSFQHSGNDVEVRNFRITRCTRAYFPYGCRDHNIDITVSDPSHSPMIDLTVQTRTAESAFLENINCSITVVDEDANLESTWCGLVIQTYEGQFHPATVRNIRLEINGTMTRHDKSIFTIQKQLDGLPDDIDRGHLIENVEVAGNVVYQVNSNSSPIQAMVAPRQGVWGADETVRSLRFCNLRLTHPRFEEPPRCRMGVTSIKDLLVFENCLVPKGFTLLGELHRGTRHINTTIGSSFYVDTLNSVQSLNGNGSPTNINLTHLLTELRTSRNTTFRLKNGKEGQEKQLIMTTSVGNAKVRPSKLRGYRTITFNHEGDAAILKFIQGEWTILSNQGCELA